MTKAEIINNGRSLFQSVENLRKSAADLTVMMDSIGTLLKELDFGGYEFFVEKSKDPDEKTEWCALARSYDVDVRQKVGSKRKKEKLLGTITIMNRLCDFKSRKEADLAHPWNFQACVVVGWHKASEWTEEEEEYWAIDHLDPEEACNIHHCGDGLWVWKNDDDVRENAYFFALPIFSISNEDDLRLRITVPLKTLFQAEDPKIHAAKALSGFTVLTPAQ